MSDAFDLLIQNARVIDGTGAPRFRADIGIQGDRITGIGNLNGRKATRVIDATRLVAAPGFIDAHTHDDRLLLSDPAMAPKVSQGVTPSSPATAASASPARRAAARPSRRWICSMPTAAGSATPTSINIAGLSTRRPRQPMPLA